MTEIMQQRPDSIGARVLERRHALGLSREALGAAAGGVSSATVYRIELGRVRPHPSTVRALLTALEQAPETDRARVTRPSSIQAAKSVATHAEP